MRYPLTSQVALVFIILRSVAAAQMFIPSVGQSIAENFWPPKNPTISSVTPLWKSALLQWGMAPKSGPVAEARQEDVIPQGSTPYPVRRSIILKFDGESHQVESTFQDSSGTTTQTNVFQDGKVQSSTSIYRRTDGKLSAGEDWRRWSYGPNGRISEFRAGHDKDENNHFLNFKYDAEKRLLSYEYRQGGSDVPFSFTEIKYERKTVTTDEFDQYHQKIFEQVQVLDVANRVVELTVSDKNTGALGLWYHTWFKYDDQGRLTEQNTEPYKVGSGDVDSEPPPGKIVIQYDDKKHTGEQDFYDPGGKLTVRSFAEFDQHGYVIKQQVVDPAGKQAKGTEDIWVDPKTHKTHLGEETLDVSYDEHGNWTAIQSWFTPADGGNRVLTRSITQTITYRQ